MAGAGLSVANEGPRDPGPVDRLALLMLDEWRRVEPDKPVGPCLMATIADLARVAVAACDRDLAAAAADRVRLTAEVARLADQLGTARARVAELEDAVRRGADLVGW